MLTLNLYTTYFGSAGGLALGKESILTTLSMNLQPYPCHIATELHTATYHKSLVMSAAGGGWICKQRNGDQPNERDSSIATSFRA